MSPKSGGAGIFFENKDVTCVNFFLGQMIIRRARGLYATDNHGLDIDELVYALDSSTIDLCLSMFPWAHFRQSNAAIQLHTMIDLKGSIPVFISITD